MKHGADSSTGGPPLGGNTPQRGAAKFHGFEALAEQSPRFWWRNPASGELSSQVRLPVWRLLNVAPPTCPVFRAIHSHRTLQRVQNNDLYWKNYSIDRHLTHFSCHYVRNDFGILRCQQLWLWLSNSHDFQCRLTHDFYNAKNFEKDGAMVSIVSCVGRYLTAQLPRQVSINSFWYRTSISNCICDKFPDPWYCCVGAETIAIIDIWANHSISLTWNKTMLGYYPYWPLFQWGRSEVVMIYAKMRIE